MRDFVAGFPLAGERGFSPDFAGADSGLSWAGSEWDGTGPWVAATEPTRPTHKLVLLPMFHAADTLRSRLAGCRKLVGQI